MPDSIVPTLPPADTRHWPEGISRVPFWLYQDADVLKSEQRKIFEGPAWHFLCLEVEIENQGDYRTTQVGDMPVVVVRGENNEIGRAHV